MREQNRISVPLRFCCAIASADPEIIAKCNNVDRRRIVRHALALICTFTMAAVLWSAVFSEMLPDKAAIFGGLFVGLVIYLLDLSIATSDWDLKGVLRERTTFSLESLRRVIVKMVKFGSRLVLALTLAVVTGTYVTLFWFNDTIGNFIHQKRLSFNAPIEAEYRAEREKLQAELIGPVQRDMALVQDQRKNYQKLLGDSQDKLSRAEEAVTAARLDIHREETGLNRPGGRGKLFRDAEIRFEEANRHTAIAQREVENTRAHLREIDTRIDAINTRLQTARESFAVKTERLAAERDVKLMPERSDFLMKFKALEELKNDPVYGVSMTYVAWLTKLTIIILESVFIIILLNDHASLYNLHLICRTRLEAQRVDAEFVSDLAKIKKGVTFPRTPLAKTYMGTSTSDIPTHNQDHTIPTDPLAEPVMQSSDTRGGAGQPIFSVPEQPAEDGGGHGETACANPCRADEPISGDEADRYPVVGGKPDERVSTAQALANCDHYWVNPERPDEIWNREYYDAVRGQGIGKAA